MKIKNKHNENHGDIMNNTILIGTILGCSILSAINLNASQKTSYTYSDMGQVLTVDGSRTSVSDITTFTYDELGNRTSITNALGHVTQFTSHDLLNRLLTVIDANGITTNLTYHPRGWLLSSTVVYPGDNPALNAVTTFGYDPVGMLELITLPNANTLTFNYDDANRLTAIENGLGERIEYTLDGAGNRTLEVIKDDSGTIQKSLTRTFDELSRIRNHIGAASQTNNFNYDVNSNQTQSIDGKTNSTDNAYDSLNRLTTVTDANSNTFRLTYNNHDLITSVTDQKDNTTSYVYDGYDDLKELHSPDMGSLLFTHDNASNVLTKKDAKGVLYRYSYDALNRLTSVINSVSSSGNITYSYDDTANGNYGIGRLTLVTDSSGSIAYNYGHRGNITNATYSIGDNTYTLGYQYTMADQVKSITYPDGRTLNYLYDLAGQISNISTTKGETTSTIANSISYKPFSGITALTYGNGLNYSASYDLDYRLNQIEVGTGSIQDIVYSYDDNNNISNRADNTGNDADTAYNHDNLNRLKDATTSEGVKTFDYDAVSNRTSLNDEDSIQTNYTYEQYSNRLETESSPGKTLTATYDDNGNILSKAAANGEGLYFSYNVSNRLSEVKEKTLNGGAGLQEKIVATYAYNSLGQRVEKVNTSITTHYVYHLDGTLLFETTIDSSSKKHYLHHHGDGLAQGVAIVVNNPNQSPAIVDKVLFQHNDHLNTPKKLTDASRAVVWSASHTAFGLATINEDVDGDGSTITLNTRFPGQQYDAETGLHYNYFRYYDPSTGRYITSDPIGLAGGLNTYGYVGGNPMVYGDPLGLDSQISFGGSGSLGLLVAGVSGSLSFGISIPDNLTNLGCYQLFGSIQLNGMLGGGVFGGLGLSSTVGKTDGSLNILDGTISNYAEISGGMGTAFSVGANTDGTNSSVSLPFITKVGAGFGAWVGGGKSLIGTLATPTYSSDCECQN